MSDPTKLIEAVHQALDDGEDRDTILDTVNTVLNERVGRKVEIGYMGDEPE